MYLPTQPEDSILRRHFETTVEMQRHVWLRKPPSDSTLSRHAMHLSSHHMYAASTPAKTLPPSAATADAPARQAAVEKRGLFVRLFGRFIGRT